MNPIVYFSLPATGHVNPSLGVIRELVARGERVIYFSSPDFRGVIEATGAEYRDYGSISYDAKRPDRDIIKLTLGLLRSGGELLPRLEAALQNEKIDFVLYDAYAPWGRFFADRRGLPKISFIPTFAFNAKVVGRFSSPLRLLWSGLKSFPYLMTYLFESLRFKMKFKARGVGFLSLFATRAPLNIVFTSRSFQALEKTFDEGYRFVGPILEGRLDPEIFPFEKIAGKPLVFVSLGTLYNDRPDFYLKAVRALSGLDAFTVVSTGDLLGEKFFRESEAVANERVFIRRRVPQLEILKRASVFLSHGGMNSVSESLFHGVPLLVFPQIDEQRFVSQRVAELGAGLMLSEKDLRADRIAEKISRILREPSYGENARRIGETLRAAGGAPKAAREILDSTRSRYFEFETDFVDKLACIPMSVRRKLDLSGVKLKLAEWSKLSFEERNLVSQTPCLDEDSSATFRNTLIPCVESKSGSKPASLPIPKNPPWLSKSPPPLLVERAREHGAQVDDTKWRRLSELERFALLKLCRESHESRNFLPALREFKIL